MTKLIKDERTIDRNHDGTFQNIIHQEFLLTEEDVKTRIKDCEDCIETIEHDLKHLCTEENIKKTTVALLRKLEIELAVALDGKKNFEKYLKEQIQDIRKQKPDLIKRWDNLIGNYVTMQQAVMKNTKITADKKKKRLEVQLKDEKNAQKMWKRIEDGKDKEIPEETKKR